MAKRHPPLLRGVTRFLHGGDYNPDQWLDRPDVIDEDFRLMRLAGCNAFSVGIFAWTALEPEDGVFSMDWLAAILDRMAVEGHQVALATPSGAKPNWLGSRCEEVRRVTRAGVREPQWLRHNHCPTSPVYRRHVERIDGELARRFGRHPAVALWHVSNEYSGECLCPLCLEAFRAWLRRRYGVLEALNGAWCTAFWSRTFTAWEEIDPWDTHIDGLQLDWRRFVTEQTVDFFRHEVAALRQHSPLPVTTNLMGTFPGLDYWRLAPHCDLIANDSYPTLHDRPDTADVASRTGMVHDLMRSLGGGKPFLQMECTPSSTNWMEHAKLKRPGMHRLEMLQAIGHGADGTMYFQWRKGRGGHEKLHGAVVDHAGHERTRVFGAVADHGALLSRLEGVLGCGASIQVGLIHDWESRWALATSQGPRNRSASDDKDYVAACQQYHRAFWRRTVMMDVVDRHADLARYRLVLAPMLYLLDEDSAERLRRFVHDGGVLVATYLSGIVDESNRCHLGGWPGPDLRELFGIWAEEIDVLYHDDRQSVSGVPGNPLGLTGPYQVSTFCDQVHAESASVLATYDAQFYAGRPAVTVNRYGRGSAYYVAARCDEPFVDALAAGLARSLHLHAVLEVPPPSGVSAVARDDGSDQVLFLLNFTDFEQTVEIGHEPAADLESGESVNGGVRLAAYGSRVLRRRLAHR